MTDDDTLVIESDDAVTVVMDVEVEMPDEPLKTLKEIEIPMLWDAMEGDFNKPAPDLVDRKELRAEAMRWMTALDKPSTFPLKLEDCEIDFKGGQNITVFLMHFYGITEDEAMQFTEDDK